ncbi:MAG: hypothetical protein VX315_01765 [Pseudomonadota bacterium]|nr:hypothetical protein [Pseudomonadota bacterium]
MPRSIFEKCQNRYFWRFLPHLFFQKCPKSLFWHFFAAGFCQNHQKTGFLQKVHFRKVPKSLFSAVFAAPVFSKVPEIAILALFCRRGLPKSPKNGVFAKSAFSKSAKIAIFGGFCRGRFSKSAKIAIFGGFCAHVPAKIPRNRAFSCFLNAKLGPPGPAGGAKSGILRGDVLDGVFIREIFPGFVENSKFSVPGEKFPKNFPFFFKSGKNLPNKYPIQDVPAQNPGFAGGPDPENAKISKFFQKNGKIWPEMCSEIVSPGRFALRKCQILPKTVIFGDFAQCCGQNMPKIAKNRCFCTSFGQNVPKIAQNCCFCQFLPNFCQK